MLVHSGTVVPGPTHAFTTSSLRLLLWPRQVSEKQVEVRGW